jgi:hypothetical protein
MHQPESGSDPHVSDRTESSGRQGAGCFLICAQNLNEHELSFQAASAFRKTFNLKGRNFRFE